MERSFRGGSLGGKLPSGAFRTSKFNIPEKTGDKRTQTLPSTETSGRGSVSSQGISREVGRLEGSCRKAVDTSNIII